MHRPPYSLQRWETPKPGDLISEGGRAIPSRAIQLADFDDTNHDALLVLLSRWRVIESVADGVIEHERPAPCGYILRLTEHEPLAMAIVDEARWLAAEKRPYNPWAIVWHAGDTLAEQHVSWALVPAFLLDGHPALAVAAVVARPVGELLRWVAARPASRSRGMICSQAAVTAIVRACRPRYGVDPDAQAILLASLTDLLDLPAYQVSPIDLQRALTGKGDRAVTVLPPVLIGES